MFIAQQSVVRNHLSLDVLGASGRWIRSPTAVTNSCGAGWEDKFQFAIVSCCGTAMYCTSRMVSAHMRTVRVSRVGR